MTIQILPEQVASKIAAGEVVERPASVVKELLENSLDARASRIRVEVRSDGAVSIRVVDNGDGIVPGEVRLAFHRHATSKLALAEDLENIMTLGFRGEALPSISAVSCVHMVTRHKDSQDGWEVRLRWGKVESEGPQGGPPGTTTTVSNLFDNIPVRKKFLRSTNAESGRIGNLMSRYVLAYPAVRFELTVNGRTALESPGSGKLEEALAAVYGADITQQMLQINPENLPGGYRVDGYVSPFSLSRPNRNQITFFVNSRWVQSRILSVALEQAYHGLLAHRRHPMAIVNIKVPPWDVDVNVHPTKKEVKFRQEGLMFSIVQRAVRGTLMALSPVPQIDLAPKTPAGKAYLQAVLLPTSAVMQKPSEEELKNHEGDHHTVNAPMLRVLGQALNTYLVAEGPDGIFLVDQHAAHERVIYERILKGMMTGKPSVQALLEPVPVELSPAYLEIVKDDREKLELYGFQLEPFGGNTYLLRTVPTIFRNLDAAKSLRETLDMVVNEGYIKDRMTVLAASIACHGAVRAGMSLTYLEMVEMLELLEMVENPHTCPHGRPTMLHLSSRHLEREFGRR